MITVLFLREESEREERDERRNYNFTLGHYVPNAAARVVLGNSQNKQQINFKGFMVGSKLTSNKYYF